MVCNLGNFKVCGWEGEKLYEKINNKYVNASDKLCMINMIIWSVLFFSVGFS